MPLALQKVLVRLYEWLAVADSSGDGDLIFALAGRQSRKRHALEMFSQGQAPRLLLSVGRFEIRLFEGLPCPVKLNLPRRAAAVAPAQRHLFVYLANTISEVEFIPKGRLGTLSEIRALQTWLECRSEIKSVIIVSGAAHLRRVRLCCRGLLPAAIQLRLLPANDEDAWMRRDLWWRTGRTRSIVLPEFPKLLLYWLVLRFQSATRNVARWLFSSYESIP